MFCHVSHTVTDAPPSGSCISCLHRAPLRCAAAGSLCRAYRGRAGAPVGAGAVRTPDCARAQGSRRAHFSCPFPPGFFSAPAAVLRRKGKGGPRKPPLPAPIIPHFLTGQAIIEKYFKRIVNKLLSSDGSAEMRRDAPRGRPSVPVIRNRLRVEPVGRDEAVVPLFHDLHLDRDSLQSARDKRS